MMRNEIFRYIENEGFIKVEKELNAAKRFNKIAIIIIIIMQILMGVMVVNMQHLAEQYRQLESKYEELYEERSKLN